MMVVAVVVMVMIQKVRVGFVCFCISMHISHNLKTHDSWCYLQTRFQACLSCLLAIAGPF